MTTKEALLLYYVNKKTDLQIKLKDDPSPPYGPGKLELVTVDVQNGGEGNSAMGVPFTARFFKQTAPALIQGPGGQPHEILLPIIFSADDVLWITEGPINKDREKLIQEIPSKKTPGGLHIG